jgi:L-amino acid N-acyltransferase YncA
VNKPAKRYPRSADCKDGPVQLDLLVPEDRERLLVFADELPEHDLLFLKRNIREPKVVDAWLSSVAAGDIYSITASRDGKILGCTALLSDKLSWSAHVGELRVLVASEMREQGLGRLLIQECFIVGLELGLEKLVAQMTTDQEAAMSVFEDMGFRTEALLKDHVQDNKGTRYDLIMLSHDVEQFHAQLDVYGLTEAF